ncbi:MAG: NAD(P)H-binding protein [Pseudonocardia sp.]
MRVAVTGASGPLGAGVVRGLVERLGAGAVLALSRTPVDLGVASRRADFDDPDALVAAFDGVERLLVVSTPRIGHRRVQHRAAIAAAARAGVGHVFYTSGIGVDLPGNPSPVVPDHADAETALAASGLRYTALRNGVYTETLLLAARPAVAAGVYATSGGHGATSYVTRDDLAAATAAILADPADPGRALELTGAEAVTGADVAAVLTGLADREVRYQPLTDEMIEAGMVRAGLPAEAVAMALEFGRAARGGFLGEVTDTVTRYLERPPVGVARFLSRHRSALVSLPRSG